VFPILRQHQFPTIPPPPHQAEIHTAAATTTSPMLVAAIYVRSLPPASFVLTYPARPRSCRYPPKPLIRPSLHPVQPPPTQLRSILPATLELTPLGDMVLSLISDSGTITLATVSSHFLTSSSHVFRAMLSPRFCEGLQLSVAALGGDVFTLTLDEDDAHAMIIILQVLHRHPDTPKAVSYQELLEIAVLAEKYDFYEALVVYRAWCTERWVRDLKPSVGPDEYHNWILVAWRFGSGCFFGRFPRCCLRVGWTGWGSLASTVCCIRIYLTA